MRKLKAILVLLIVVSTAASCLRGQAEETLSEDGFLDREYAVSLSEADHAESQLSRHWMAMQTIIVPGGHIRVNGVGDENDEFQLSEKGGIVRVRIVGSRQNNVTVGMKVSDGDLKASQMLHERFREILNSGSMPGER